MCYYSVDTPKWSQTTNRQLLETAALRIVPCSVIPPVLLVQPGQDVGEARIGFRWHLVRLRCSAPSLIPLQVASKATSMVSRTRRSDKQCECAAYGKRPESRETRERTERICDSSTDSR